MNSHKENICPNCNHPVNGNYCAECGQQAHLHNDSFIGLISHFISHYFHFESKFWVTLKTLIIHPGKLAVAYHEKQRMRYIQPVSLYIFISVAFFILFAYTMSFEQRTVANPDKSITMTQRYSLGLYAKRHSHENDNWAVDYNCDSLRQVKQDLKESEEERMDYFKKEEHSFRFSKAYFFETFYNYYIYPYAYRHQMYDIDTPVSVIYEKFFHILPKIFFILMPLMALLLYMAFFSKKGYKFVDYGVMSLYTHVFMFISAAVLILIVGSFTDASDKLWLLIFLVLIPLMHFLVSCRNFFHRSWLYTILAGTVTWAIYLSLVIFVAIMVLLLVINFT